MPSSRRPSKSGNSRGRCLQPGPIGRNPYLNFLRVFRKQNCGLSPVETVRQGAKEWKRLSNEDKLRYIKEAFYAPKRRRSMSSAMCGPVVRRRARSTVRKISLKRAARSRRRTSVC